MINPRAPALRRFRHKRTKAALAAARRRGVQLGGNRGKLTPEIRRRAQQQSVAARRKAAARFQARVLPLVQQIKASGARMLQQAADELTRRNVNTPRGAGRWQPTQVMCVLRAA